MITKTHPITISLVIGFTVGLASSGAAGQPVNDYRDNTTLGACCSEIFNNCDGTSGGCFTTDAATCASLGGGFTYLGDNTSCGVFTYTENSCADVYATIAGTPLSQLIVLTDEDAQFFNLNFIYVFFGELKQSVAMTSNGYLTFTDPVTIDPSPDAIPNAATPNDMIAALWTDLDPGTGAGEIWVAIDSLTNNAVFEWRNVGVFDAAGAIGDNDFQIHLNGDTMCIKLIYGNLDLNGLGAQPTNADTVVGLEDPDTSAFNAVDVETPVLANSCIEFCPQNDGSSDCSASCSFCAGDANKDGIVDVNDISFVLFRLGDPGGACIPGDANGDGVNDMNDISHVLFRLGNTLPTCNGTPCP